MQIQIEWSDPLQVSKGDTKDTIQIIILSPDHFMSQSYDEILEIDDQQ